MRGLLPQLLPLAFGAAVSPVVLTAVVLTLASRSHPRERAAAFTLGAVVPLLVVGLGGLAIFASVPEVSHRRDPAVSAAIDLSFGVVLLLLALRAVLSPPPPSKAGSPRAAPGDDRAHLWRYLVLGVASMVTNFSTLVLFVPAVKEIARARLSVAGESAAFALLLAITLIPALVPLLFYMLAPQAAERVLTPLGDWASSHKRILGVAVAVVLGVWLSAKGLLGL